MDRHDFQIAPCQLSSTKAMGLASLFQSEWPEFTFKDYSSKLPSPLIAECDGRLIGGLAYSFYEEPGSEKRVIWLNAVFVIDEFRGCGVASQLIARSLDFISSHQQKTLYAYTNVPTLYEGLGWIEIPAEAEPQHKVMGKSL